MARSAYFACMDCKIKIWIGASVFYPNDTVNYFNAFGGKKRNWEDSNLNRVIWKMLADHASHQLRVLVEWTPEFEAFAEDEEVVQIDGDIPGYFISFEEYLKGWEG